MFKVYQIKNQVNGKKYIGITHRLIDERFQEHVSRANNNHRDNRLCMAMRKYGVENFAIKLIDSCDDEDEEGMRAFCSKHKLHHMYTRGSCKGFVLLKRFRDHPEREYTQASGSAGH